MKDTADYVDVFHTNMQNVLSWCQLQGKREKSDLVQPEDSPLKDGQGLGVNSLSVIGPASNDVPPASVSLCQGDTQRVWQEKQCQEETHHVEGSSCPKLVPAHIWQCTIQHSGGNAPFQYI